MQIEITPEQIESAAQKGAHYGMAMVMNTFSADISLPKENHWETGRRLQEYLSCVKVAFNEELEKQMQKAVTLEKYDIPDNSPFRLYPHRKKKSK